MAACEERLGALIDFVSGELPEARRHELEQHLWVCEACRAEAQELRETETVLRASSRTPDDLHLSGFAFRVADRAERFRDRSSRGLWWSLTRAMRVTLVASAAALVVSVSLFVLSHRTVPAVLPITNAGSVVSTAGTDSGLPDLSQLVAEDGAMPDVSLDSALDALSPEELDTLTQKLAVSSG